MCFTLVSSQLEGLIFLNTQKNKPIKTPWHWAINSGFARDLRCRNQSSLRLSKVYGLCMAWRKARLLCNSKIICDDLLRKGTFFMIKSL